jgi:hypothetical protein
MRSFLYNFYSSPKSIRVIKSRRKRHKRHVACMGDKRYAYRILDKKCEAKRPLERPRNR